MTSNCKDDDVATTENSSTGSMSLEGLRKYLAEKLHIGESSSSSNNEKQSAAAATRKEKVLEEVSLDGIVNYMKSGKCANIITLAGAGISTAAGIPDFRSPNSGLYANLHKYKLPYPQAIFELDFFEKEPRPFFVLAKELYPGRFKPTIAHYFLKLLEQKGLLLRHYTQNIDTLERVAGLSEHKLVEAHGTFYTGHCLVCKTLYTLPWMKERIFADKVPMCESCPNGVVKPDIVFFGESLPAKFEHCIETDFGKCDLLVVLGSSLVVQPFASLVDRVPDSCPRLLINREKVGQNSGVMALLGFGGGLDFDNPGNTRDVAWLGDCDDGCQLLAEKLGWKDELSHLVNREEHRKQDKEHEEKEKKTETEPEPESTSMIRKEAKEEKENKAKEEKENKAKEEKENKAKEEKENKAKEEEKKESTMSKSK